MYLTSSGDALLLHLKVVPNSRRTHLAGILGDALKIKIAQPPEDNRANRAVMDLLAGILQLPPSALTLAAGHTSPRKTLRITGLSFETAAHRLSAALAP